MPELPDVERNRTLVQRQLVGSRIDHVEATDPTVLRNTTLAQANKMLRGRLVTEAARVGKWLSIITDGPIIVVHFGMTGTLRWVGPADDLQRYDRLSFVTAGGQLRYNDMRKLQGIWLAVDESQALEIIGPQGPDALTMPRTSFRQISAHRGTIKAALMNQVIIGGLGNMLTDEVLWRARIHPARSAAGLTVAELDDLHRVIRSTLRSAVKAGAIPRSRTWLSSQRASDEPTCPRCRRPLTWTQINGRSSLWCPNEQQPGDLS